MNIAIILSGGKGLRFGENIPKQYIEVKKIPILVRTLFKFEESECINKIIVVAQEDYIQKINEYKNDYHITKLCDIVTGGTSRQESILCGLKKAIEINSCNDTKVIIHDSVRPMVSEKLIKETLNFDEKVDGTMPIISVKDTIYYSVDKLNIKSVPNRNYLFQGQSPEGFYLKKYYDIHFDENKNIKKLDEVHGSSQFAFENNLKIKLIEGDEKNFKITTKIDLNRYILELEKYESI